MSEESWRVLDLEPGDGAWNMAVDEAILSVAASGSVVPTLRLYTWSRPCVSVGCIQPVADLELAACASQDLPLIRRASGGTAVLHEAALAYSLILPLGHHLAPKDIVESYRRLGSPIVRALGQLGVAGQLVPPEAADRGGRSEGLGRVACFVGLAPYEVLVDGRKLVGNSQLRRRGVVLHHAMVPLSFHARRFASLLRTASAEEQSALARLLEARIGSLHGVLGATPDPAAVAEAIKLGFAESLDVQLLPSDLTPEERSAAERLVATKYGHDEWTMRR